MILPVLSTIIASIFIFSENYESLKSQCKVDSIGSIHQKVINYIQKDTNLNNYLLLNDIDKICISNSLVFLPNAFFLKEYVDYYFLKLDSNLRNDIFNFSSYLIIGCEGPEIENYFEFFDVEDKCEAILYMSELKNNFIRVDVEIINQYSKEWKYSEVAFNSYLTFSYLFIIKDNSIVKVFSGELRK